MATALKGPSKGPLYITEWMEECDGVSDQALADKLGVQRETVWRYRMGERRPSPAKIAQIEKALEIAPGSLFRRPTGRPSLDAIVQGIPEDLHKTVVDIVTRLVEGGK